MFARGAATKVNTRRPLPIKRIVLASAMALCLSSLASVQDYDVVIQNGCVMDPETQFDQREIDKVDVDPESRLDQQEQVDGSTALECDVGRAAVGGPNSAQGRRCEWKSHWLTPDKKKAAS